MSYSSTSPGGGSSWDIKRRIINVLLHRHFPSLRKIDIDVDSGTVTLRGTVASFYERQVCLSCCQHTPGVFRLVDNINVQWCDETPEMAAMTA